MKAGVTFYENLFLDLCLEATFIQIGISSYIDVFCVQLKKTKQNYMCYRGIINIVQEYKYE